MVFSLVNNFFDVNIHFCWPLREIYIIYIKLNIKSSSIGRDAKKTVIMKEDSEMEDGRSSLKEDIARKYSTYFLSLLHHNNGYFIQVRSHYLIYITTSHSVCVVWVSEPLCRHSQYLPDRLLTRRQVCQVIYCVSGSVWYLVVRYGTQALKYLSYDQVTRLSMPNPMCTVFPTITR